jgi:cell division protein FtsL
MPTFQRIFISFLGYPNRSDLRIAKHKNRQQKKIALNKRFFLALLIAFAVLTLVMLFLKMTRYF